MDTKPPGHQTTEEIRDKYNCKSHIDLLKCMAAGVITPEDEEVLMARGFEPSTGALLLAADSLATIVERLQVGF